MIFVTVGLHTQGFERLIKKIDEIARLIEEEVVTQIGYSAHEPKNTKWFRFVDNKDIASLYEKARVVVTHGGAGCILTALSYGKPLIVVPRLKKFHEHVDDHQVQLAQELEKQGLLTVVYDVNDLVNLVRNARKICLKRRRNTTTNLVNNLKEYINADN